MTDTQMEVPVGDLLNLECANHDCKEKETPDATGGPVQLFAYRIEDKVYKKRELPKRGTAPTASEAMIGIARKTDNLRNRLVLSVWGMRNVSDLPTAAAKVRNVLADFLGVLPERFSPVIDKSYYRFSETTQSYDVDLDSNAINQHNLFNLFTDYLQTNKTDVQPLDHRAWTQVRHVQDGHNGGSYLFVLIKR
tara:strand:- start:332 stop:910 length:579 start_codon:yes stop_codon:yes gene_type:complete